LLYFSLFHFSIQNGISHKPSRNMASYKSNGKSHSEYCSLCIYSQWKFP
ncbi:hypothetical protein NT06LI_0008a, partial [Listeria innocua FSL J1-023]